MDRRRYDLARLRTDLRFTAETVSDLKKRMRQSNYTPTLQQHRDLAQWKRSATILCCLRANHRGKMHLPDRAKNLVYVRAIESKYLLKEAEAA